MPEILFDGRKLAVPAGMNLVDAGVQAGVSVPIRCERFLARSAPLRMFLLALLKVPPTAPAGTVFGAAKTAPFYFSAQ